MNDAAIFQTLRWIGGTDGHLRLIDQTRLPTELVEIDCRDVESVFEAIQSLRVRGAPAIGVAAAYGVCVGVQTALNGGADTVRRRVRDVADFLANSRPTAVNLAWVLARMRRVSETVDAEISARELTERLLNEAHSICSEDHEMCRAIGRHGAVLLHDGQGVLTHCNAGGLATSQFGTALGVLFAAQESGKQVHAFVGETRPLLQGSRLTAWELKQRGIETTLICDSMAAQVMREGRVQAVVVGADRIAANGDTANKIGTYSLALLAAAHEIPFYVAAPSSTFDLRIESGDQIPIEHRDPREITHGFGQQTAPDGVRVYNPAFDVTPARLITAMVCERGVIRPVTRETIRAMLK
jgi:methylthioribose-1-phosphate isomerase